MSRTASCSNTFNASGIGYVSIETRGLAREQPSKDDQRGPGINSIWPAGEAMNVIVPAPVRPGRIHTVPSHQGPAAGEDLMTRSEVASLFGVTSAAVATWARRGRLPEVRNEASRPRYRRADVEALMIRSGVRRRSR
jgi:MerR HTH family regulatory protein